MNERLQGFRNLVDDRQNLWRSSVGIPYVTAYTAAYDSYKDTVDKQKKTDEARGELFITAASIATGSILMATVATSSIRVLAGRTLMGYAQRNLATTFGRLIQTTGKNEAITFALGKFLDQVDDAVSKEAKGIAAKWIGMNAGIITPAPLVQYAEMERILINNKLCAYEMADMIEGSRALNDGAKNAAYAVLRQAPIANAPVRRGVESKLNLAELIELCFYLANMLDTDRLIDWPASTPQGEVGKTRSRPIAQMPSATNYPRPKTPLPNGFGITPAHQSVAIERAGSDIQARTNELATKLTGQPIYGSTFFGFGGPSDSDKPAELLKAEKVLNQIARAARPLSVLDARG